MTPTVDRFRYLGNVDLNGMLPGVVVFMEGLEGTALTSLEIVIQEDPDSTSPPWEDVCRLEKALTMGGTESLQSLIIEDFTSILPTLRLSGASDRLDVDDGSSQFVPSTGFIDCFLRFRNLDILQYRADSFYLYGSEIERIIESASWRQTLRHFGVFHDDDDDVPRQHNNFLPNFQQLQGLVFALPNLKIQSTCIQLNNKMPSPSSFSLPPGPPSKLETLRIATREFLEEDSIIPIAECPDYFFPALKWFRVSPVP